MSELHDELITVASSLLSDSGMDIEWALYNAHNLITERNRLLEMGFESWNKTRRDYEEDEEDPPKKIVGAGGPTDFTEALKLEVAKRKQQAEKDRAEGERKAMLADEESSVTERIDEFIIRTISTEGLVDRRGKREFRYDPDTRTVYSKYAIRSDIFCWHGHRNRETQKIDLYVSGEGPLTLKQTFAVILNHIAAHTSDESLGRLLQDES